MLANKIVMITGVGSGLGRALAVAFAEQGSRVIGIARREETLRETAALISAEQFAGYVADVSRFAEIKTVVDTVAAEHGRIDIVFNNAAVYPRVNFLAETPEDFAQALDVNVTGVANVCKAVLPMMQDSGYGRIYNVGSFADIAPIADSAVYSASKGAVRALTKAIAADVQSLDADIEVHEWIPGHLKTQMSGFTGIEPEVAAAWGVQIASIEHARTPNCIFENDYEWLPPQGLKQRIRNKLRALLGSGSDES